MEAQTRNHDGELKFFETIGAAFAHAEEDKTVWKISWTNESTDERVRLVRHSKEHQGQVYHGRWIYEPIDIEAELASQFISPDEFRKMMGIEETDV